MQVNSPPTVPLPNLAALPAQPVRQLVQPPAAPVITPRAIDSGEQGQKGQTTSSATQKPNVQTRSTASKNTGRGSQLDVLV